MRYRVFCFINTPKKRKKLKETIVEAASDQEALETAVKSFSYYSSRNGYTVEPVIFDMI